MIQEAKDIEYLNTLSDYKITLNEFSKVLVYKVDNKIVAFLDYSVIYEKIEINYIYVIEAYRNNKIAYKLINYIINTNHENITLEVSILNEYAIKLYKSLGFNVVAIRPKYYNGIDAYLMERRNI